MAILKKGNPQDVSGKDYGPTYDPFTYGWSTEVGYIKQNKDKYVTSGTYNSETDELDLKIEGIDEGIKINMSGITSEDKSVKGGTSTINKDEQKLTLDVENGKGVKEQINIDLSGLGETYYSKGEVDDKFTWGTF